MSRTDDVFANAQRAAKRQFDEDEAERRHRLSPPIGGTIGGPPGFGPAVAGIPGIGRGLPPATEMGGWMQRTKIPVAMPDGRVEMLPIGSDGVVHPPYPASTNGGPYTVWMDNYTEGWHPGGPFDTLKECFDAMRAVAHCSDYRITKDVTVEFKEVS